MACPAYIIAQTSSVNIGYWVNACRGIAPWLATRSGCYNAGYCICPRSWLMRGRGAAPETGADGGHGNDGQAH